MQRCLSFRVCIQNISVLSEYMCNWWKRSAICGDKWDSVGFLFVREFEGLFSRLVLAL